MSSIGLRVVFNCFTCAMVLCASTARAQDSAAPSAASDAPASDSDAADAVGFADAPGVPSAPSQTTGSDEAGFAPAASETPSIAIEAEAPSAWTLGATIWLRGAVRLTQSEPSRISNFRQTLEARIGWKHDLGAGWELRALASGRTEVDFAVLADLEAYSPPEVDLYAWQLMPRETYLALAGPVIDLRFGEQIVNLGQGEVLSVLDIVNPRDVREPLLTDPGATRMPVLMTRIAAASESLRAELLVVHEPYFGLTPPPLGEWSPFRRLLLESPGFGTALANRTLTTVHVPARNVGNFDATQVHGRAGWSGHGIDLTLSASSVLDPLGVPVLPPAAAFDAPEIAFPVIHPRFTLFGHSGALTLGPFVLRWEAAFEMSRAIALRDTSTPLLRFSSVRRHGLRGMLGLTYLPSTSTNGSLEIVQGYVFDNPNRDPAELRATLFPLESPQIALRFNHRFLRDRAQVSVYLLVIGLTQLNAWAGRADFGYTITDGLEFTLGAVTYQPTDNFGFFYGFDHHERLFADLRWDIGS